MSTHLKKANLALVLLLIISLCLSGNVKAAPENSDLYRASFTKKSPANQTSGLATTGVKLQWNAIDDVFQYRYCYYSYELTNNVCDIDDKSTWKTNGTSTSVTLPTLSSGKIYYWQVFAKLEDNSVAYADGSLSAKWSFTVGQTTVGAGIYDNTHSNWIYSGKWATLTGTGPYKSTYKESRDIPDYATFAFTGARVKLYYTQKSGRGVMNIYMDGSTAPIALNQTGDGTLVYQKSWMSGALTNGNHTIKLVYVSGGYVDIDAIEVFAQADTTAPATISLSATSGANAGTVALNWNAVGDDANTGQASSYLIRYSTSPISDETAWASATVITKGVPTPKAAGQAESMTVQGLTPGLTYYFAVRAQDDQFNISALSSDSAVAYDPPPAGTGVHDDRAPQWYYSNNWSLFDSTGAYQNTVLSSTTVGSTAQFTFDGSQFVLIYTGNTNRGTLDVFIDDNPIKVATINEYSAARAWQARWVSNDLGAGEHTVKLVHATGAKVEIDGIEIMTYAPPLDTVKYDDVNAGWTYNNFTATTSTGPYLGTFHYSKMIGSTAEFTFDGSRITIYYSEYTNRGTMDVYIDGALETTIDQYGSSRVWQVSWTSNDLGPGPHIVQLVHANGAQVEIDAIEIKAEIPPAGIGTWDDTAPNWVYDSGYLVSSGSNAYGGSSRYSTTVGSTAQFTFDGSQFVLIYTGNTNRGTLDVFIDDNPIKVATINEYSAALAWQARWVSNDLGAGEHTVKLVHATGARVEIDGIEVKDYAAPPSVDIYDDDDAGWTYNNFTATTSTGPYLGTFHYSKVIGSTAEFTFDGSRITIYYSAYSNRGTLEVYIDGALETTINEYGSARVWQASWTSGDLGPGPHIVQLVHAGGAQVDIDAIEVWSP